MNVLVGTANNFCRFFIASRTPVVFFFFSGWNWDGEKKDESRERIAFFTAVRLLPACFY